MKEKIGNLTRIKTGKLDANASCENGLYPFFTCSVEPLKINTYSYDCECVLLAGNGDLNVKYYKGKFDAYQRTYIIESNDKNILSVPYLYYFMAEYVKELRKQSIGGVIKYIKLGNITEAFIKLPNMSEQNKIVEILNKAKETIELRRKELEQLDLLIKARFVEMFGKPFENQKNWEMKPLSECCTINPSKIKKDDDNLDVSFIPMTSVSEKGSIDTSNIKKYGEVKKGFTSFIENDVLFAKITPCMENGKGCIAHNLMNKIGFGSTEFHVLRPIENISTSRWIYHLTTFSSFRKIAEKNMTGTGGQRRTPKSFFDNIKISLPPISLQNEFTIFAEQVDKSKVVQEFIVDYIDSCYNKFVLGGIRYGKF